MSRRRFEVLAWFAFVFVANAIDATSVLMEYHRDGRSLQVWEPFTWEFSSGLFTLLTIPVILAVESRVPITLETWKRAIPVHLVATIPVSLLHVTGMVGIRKAVYALNGEVYDFGNVPVELFYEWRKDAFSYFMVLFIVNAYRVYRERAEGEANFVDRKEPDPLSAAPHFRVTFNRRDFNLDPADVEWIESAGNYVVLHSGDRTYLMRETMKNLEERLAETAFRRIHRTRIVNLKHVTDVESADGKTILRLRTGDAIEVSRSYRPEILSSLRPSAAK